MEAGSLPVVSAIALRGNQPLNDSGKQEKVKSVKHNQTKHIRDRPWVSNDDIVNLIIN